MTLPYLSKSYLNIVNKCYLIKTGLAIPPNECTLTGFITVPSDERKVFIYAKYPAIENYYIIFDFAKPQKVHLKVLIAETHL